MCQHGGRPVESVYTRIAAVKFRKQVVKTFSTGKGIWLLHLRARSLRNSQHKGFWLDSRRGLFCRTTFFRLASHQSTSFLHFFSLFFPLFYISFIFVKHVVQINNAYWRITICSNCLEKDLRSLT